jgi:PmbA protein
MAAKRRVMIEQGVLQGFNISVYHGRKLGCEPTSGSRSNWIIRPGDRPWKDAVADAPRAIWVSSFLGGNSNGTTGDFSFGIRGMLLENGEPIGSLSEMNVSGNLLEVFHKLIAVGDDPWMWSSVRSPTLVFEDVQFSGT